MLENFICSEDSKEGIEKSLKRLAYSIISTKKASIISGENESNKLSFSFDLNLHTPQPIPAIGTLLLQKSIFQIQISLASLSEGYF